MTPRVLIYTILGAAIFVGINAGTTYGLQSSLYIVRKLGAYVHWTLILMILPLFSGWLIHITRLPYTTLAIPLSSAISAFILFPAYRDQFWAEPPQLFLGFMYAAIVSGVALIPNQRLFQKARDVGYQGLSTIGININNVAKKPSKPKPRNKPKSRNTKTRKSPLQKNIVLRFLESPEYTNLLHTLKHLVALASIVLSAYSIIALGKK
ncbi:MAG: hypothetical protein IMF03_08455 [Proteobacteria bacterium]|nr:hypothetical protein [Pseudomonadota bacterium]